MNMQDLPKKVITVGSKGFDKKSYEVYPSQVVDFVNSYKKGLNIGVYSDPGNKKPTSAVFGTGSFPLPENSTGTHPKMELVLKGCPLGTYYIQATVEAIIGEMTAHLEVISPPDEESV